MVGVSGRDDATPSPVQQKALLIIKQSVHVHAIISSRFLSLLLSLSCRCTSTAFRTGCRCPVAMCWRRSGNTSRSSATASGTVRLRLAGDSGESVCQSVSQLVTLDKTSSL